MIPLSDFDAIEDRLANVGSKEEITYIRDEFKVFKQAIQDLLTMSKSAATRLDFVRKSTEASIAKRKQDESAAARGGKGTPKKNAGTSALPNFWEFAQTSFTQLTQVGVDLNGKPNEESKNRRVPLVFTMRLERSGKHQCLQEYTDAALVKFKSSTDRGTTGRQHKKIPDEVLKVFDADMEALLPTNFCVKPDAIKGEGLNKDIRSTAFVVKQSKDSAYNEFAFVPTLRMSMQGWSYVT